jgi:CBS domain-containing protein
MQVGDLMNPVETLSPQATVQDAAQRMRDLDVGALPVCDGTRLLGMLTDRDIAIRAVAEGKAPNQVKVTDAMTPDVEWCYADADVEQAAQLMEERQIRRLPIVDRDKKLVGIVALADLARHVQKGRSGDVLQGVSQPNASS